MRGRCFVGRGTVEDVKALASLEAACFSHPWTPAQIADELTAPSGTVLVARVLTAGGGVTACAWCAYRMVLDEMHLLNVAVAPEWRRKGIGRFLVTVALNRGARAGATTALLEVRAGNAGALALYRGLGFTRRGIRRQYYSSPVEDAIELERRGVPTRP